MNKKMIKLKNKQLKRHYSGKEKHDLCLTCEAIVENKHAGELGQYNKGWSSEMKDEFIENLIKKWEFHQE